ncbi:hypothetical protein DFJ74DRAFT_689723 [Hyaloraphidium curvatum]|nr:hypothetical protein DFJ74DRAFT_689723 [Hyaloraphidium curvatum]
MPLQRRAVSSIVPKFFNRGSWLTDDNECIICGGVLRDKEDRGEVEEHLRSSYHVRRYVQEVDVLLLGTAASEALDLLQRAHDREQVRFGLDSVQRYLWGHKHLNIAGEAQPVRRSQGPVEFVLIAMDVTGKATRCVEAISALCKARNVPVAAVRSQVLLGAACGFSKGTTCALVKGGTHVADRQRINELVRRIRLIQEGTFGPDEDPGDSPSFVAFGPGPAGRPASADESDGG